MIELLLTDTLMRDEAMDFFQRALVRFASALETDMTLAQTIAFVEGDFAHALGAVSITIALGSATRITAEDARHVAYDLVLDGLSLGTATFRFAHRPRAVERERARTLATPIALALAWRARTSERERLFELVRTDALTALPNRLSFDERLDGAWHRAIQTRTHVTLALFDIDFFKLFNDTHGHLAGDACLRAVGARLAESARAVGGFVARYGGEEFAFIAESLAANEAMDAVARVLHAFETHPIAHDGSTLGRVSFSAGFVCCVPTASQSIADFVNEADRSLYRAKALGRNRICSGAHTSSAAIVSRRALARTGAPVYEDETVGREADLVRIVAALRHARLVSLVGPPGIGKSRLARIAANSPQRAVADVAYVDFSLLTRESDPYAALGAVLDVAIESSHVASSVREAVRERKVLIVLDNVPGSIAPSVAELCDDILAVAADVSILATSRSAIGAAEERPMVIAGLALEAAIELLRLRSGSSDERALRAIASPLGGVPAFLESAAGAIDNVDTDGKSTAPADAAAR